jgi:hypothetical protein
MNLSYDIVLCGKWVPLFMKTTASPLAGRDSQHAPSEIWYQTYQTYGVINKTKKKNTFNNRSKKLLLERSI